MLLDQIDASSGRSSRSPSGSRHRGHARLPWRQPDGTPGPDAGRLAGSSVSPAIDRPAPGDHLRGRPGDGVFPATGHLAPWARLSPRDHPVRHGEPVRQDRQGQRLPQGLTRPRCHPGGQDQRRRRPALPAAARADGQAQGSCARRQGRPGCLVSPSVRPLCPLRRSPAQIRTQAYWPRPPRLSGPPRKLAALSAGCTDPSAPVPAGPAWLSGGAPVSARREAARVAARMPGGRVWPAVPGTEAGPGQAGAGPGAAQPRREGSWILAFLLRSAFQAARPGHIPVGRGHKVSSETNKVTATGSAITK